MSFGQAPQLGNALKYTGDFIADVPCVNNPRAPTITDTNYPLFTLWRNSSKSATLPDAEGDMWYLAKFFANVSTGHSDAIWLKLSTGTVPGGTVLSLSDTASTKVFPDPAGNIQLVGTAGQINIVSSPGSNLHTFSLAGGGTAIDQVAVDAATAPGANPVLANGSGQITITGAQVATGTIGANVIRTDSLAANSLTIEVQRSTAVAATDSTKNGVSHYSSAQFGVDANGFVTLAGSTGPAATKFAVDASTAPGTNPV